LRESEASASSFLRRDRGRTARRQTVFDDPSGKDWCTEVPYVIGRIHVDTVAATLNQGCASASPTEKLDGMMRAALIGNTNALRVLLDRGTGVNTTDKDGHTLLMEAVFGGHLDTVKELLERGADVNAQDSNGWTALMEAVAKGRADMVKALLDYGADTNVGNRNGWTALRSSTTSNTEAARILKRAAAGARVD
jgi:ankyrin repeat protein